MIRALGAFLRIDTRVHYRYFIGLFLLVAGVTILGPSAFGASKASAALYLVTLSAIGTPIIVPWWVVGNDRTTGTMWMITALPIERSQIVLLKALETLLWSIALAAVSALGIAFLGVPQAWSEIYPLVLPTAIAASFASTAAFFLLPARLALFVIFGLFFVCTRAVRPLEPILTHSKPIAVFLEALIVAVIISAISYYIATIIFSRRASPCE